jgi:hypothetical protein
MSLKILFVGATWKGSSARSLREALEVLPDVFLDEVGEDHYLPLYRSIVLRICNRIMNRWQRNDLEREIKAKIRAIKPDVMIVYKGSGLSSSFIKTVSESGLLTVNVFPDVSPHAHGKLLKKSMGQYGLVISTKIFHSKCWHSIYGYQNLCRFVPHGYDPAVHLWSRPETSHDFDVVLASTWRPEYHELMLGFARALAGKSVRIGLAGNGWAQRRNEFPDDWEFQGALYGRSYGTWIRKSKIVIAPVHTTMVLDGVIQPGDEDTTRTYELAAAFCFFLHRRTSYAQEIYDEVNEVPMWDSAEELAEKVVFYLNKDQLRAKMAAAAHRRAVPAYSIPSRATAVLDIIRTELEQRKNEAINPAVWMKN